MMEDQIGKEAVKKWGEELDDNFRWQLTKVEALEAGVGEVLMLLLLLLLLLLWLLVLLLFQHMVPLVSPGTISNAVVKDRDFALHYN